MKRIITLLAFTIFAIANIFGTTINYDVYTCNEDTLDCTDVSLHDSMLVIEYYNEGGRSMSYDTLYCNSTANDCEFWDLASAYVATVHSQGHKNRYEAVTRYLNGLAKAPENNVDDWIGLQMMENAEVTYGIDIQ